jgi:flagella basal body P-ring formation protein FlgA
LSLCKKGLKAVKHELNMMYQSILKFAFISLQSSLKNSLIYLFCFCLFLTFNPQFSSAQTQVPNRQNLVVLKEKITEFLQNQTVGYPGKTNISVGSIDPNTKLAACHNIEVFMPNGSRVWGKTSVGARCSGEANWTIYVQANISVLSQYLVAAAPLAQGSVISQEHCMFENGDLTQLPPGIFTDIAQALGRTVNISVPAGAVLRQDILKQSPVVQRGQTVTVTSQGNGFKVAAEGQALGNAAEGQVVQVKVASGQVISGIAKAGGQVEIKF